MMEYWKIDVLRRDHGKREQPRQVPKDGGPTDPWHQQVGLAQRAAYGCLSQECQDDIDDDQGIEILPVSRQVERLGCYTQDSPEYIRGGAPSAPERGQR